MTIAAIYPLARGGYPLSERDELVDYRYVCSWACAEKITTRSRSKPQFENGYELEQDTLCDRCGKRIRATIEE